MWTANNLNDGDETVVAQDEGEKKQQGSIEQFLGALLEILNKVQKF